MSSESREELLEALVPEDEAHPDDGVCMTLTPREPRPRLGASWAKVIDRRGQDLLQLIEKRLPHDWREVLGGWHIFPACPQSGDPTAVEPLVSLEREGMPPYEVRIVVRSLWLEPRLELAFEALATHSSGPACLKHSLSLAEAIDAANGRLRERQAHWQRKRYGSFARPYLLLDPFGVAKRLEALARRLPEHLFDGSTMRPTPRERAFSFWRGG